MRTRIAIFARPPIPGECKTRLAASIGPARAAELHAAFVEDTLARVVSLAELAPELHVAGEIDHPFFGALVDRFALPAPVAQVSGDLGARMAHALSSAQLVIGTDAPTLPTSILRAAVAGLASADVVLTPVADGGYAIIGASRGASFLLAASIRWSSPHALADTVRAARADGRSTLLTAPHHDVDTAGDLALLTAHLARDPHAAPATTSLLRAHRQMRVDRQIR